MSLFINKGPHIFYGLARAFPDRPFLAVEGAYGEQQREDVPNVEHRPTTVGMGRVYGETRVLVLPSAEESFGMVGVEAQLGGVPVIASDLPSLRESLGDGALFVPREDLGAWSEALRRLDDAASHEDVSRRARENAARFDIGRDAGVLEAVLEGIVRRHRWRLRPGPSELRAEREERARRIREIFQRAHQREPTVTELGYYLDSSSYLHELERTIPQLRG